MKKLSYLSAMLFLLVACCGCHNEASGKRHEKLVVVTTLFPLYDFARTVGGEKAQVTLLLPPGVEAHSFEPKPADAVKVGRADLFVFTNERMEPWVKGFLQGSDARGVTVVDASRGVKFVKGREEEEGAEKEEAHHHQGGLDPHVWLDFENAQIMVDDIASAMSDRDPAHKEYYLKNAQAYKVKLQELDRKYRDGLSNCGKRVFLHGGHYAFGYLAKRYGLRYQSASAFNAEAEPSPAKIVSLVATMRKLGLHYVFSEELLSPRVAEMLSRETGARVLMLHGAHNIGKDDLAKGVSFISLMERNLENLRTGLECR